MHKCKLRIKFQLPANDVINRCRFLGKKLIVDELLSRKIFREEAAYVLQKHTKLRCFQVLGVSTVLQLCYLHFNSRKREEEFS